MQEARHYRSDEEGDREPSFMRPNELMGEYGLAKAWGCQDNPDYKSRRRPALLENEDEGRKSLCSELDHYRTKVKRRNLIELFLDTLNADQFVATHLYGQIKTVYDDLPDSLLNLAIPAETGAEFGESFIRQRKL